MNHKALSLALVTTLAVVALQSSCTPKKSRAFVVFFGGSVTIAHGEGAAEAPQVRSEVFDGDMITTGDKSFLVIQTDDGLVIQVGENSRAAVVSLAGADKRLIALETGRILSRVSRLARGEEFGIRTPTLTASVRGTEFLTMYGGGRAAVAVGTGEVVLTRGGSPGEQRVKGGETGEVAGTGDGVMMVRMINAAEKLELSRLRAVPAVEDLFKAKKFLVEDRINEVEQVNEEINRQLENLGEKRGARAAGEESRWTLERIREKYGQIDTVTLFSGKVIQGAIISRGAMIEIFTTDGIVKVDAQKVRSTTLR
jgi:hypothetical protein